MLEVMRIQAFFAQRLDAAIMHADISNALIVMLRTLLLGLNADVSHYQDIIKIALCCLGKQPPNFPQHLSLFYLTLSFLQGIVYLLDIQRKNCIINLMGASAPGALNARGFSQAVHSRQLPDYHHITHSGIFNENYFSVGSKAKELLEIHNGSAVSNCDLYDLDGRNYFISLFMKSSTDGEARTRPLNLVIALDVSGSMNGPLKYEPVKGEPYPGESMTRTALSKRAILMLIEKLKPDDVFSFVIFHTAARTIIPSEFVSNLNLQTVRTQINAKFQSGGTTVSTGFIQALKNINNFKEKHTLNDYQHRIVMLTDVGDNSIQGEEKLIRQISDAGVSTTIIGVSTDFKSSTCERLIQVKGFNYLCAVQNSDLQTYLVDQFDYTFFMCVQEVLITVQSQDIEGISVFGSVDHNVKYPIQDNKFTVTKFKSGFPSALEMNKQGEVETKGGLILVKFTPKNKKQLPKFQVKIRASYSDMSGKQYQKLYEIDRAIEAEQYFSDDAIKKGVNLFYYTQTMRNLLKDMKEGQNILSDSNRGFYLDKLTKLQAFCPKEKLGELNTIRELIKEKNMN